MSGELKLPERQIRAIGLLANLLVVGWMLTLFVWTAASIADVVVNGSFATLWALVKAFCFFLWGAFALYAYQIPILWREHHEQRDTN